MTSIGCSSAMAKRWRTILSASETPALGESEEMQLASQLMELETEEEFENFLTDLISGVAKAAGGFINSTAGKALGGLLKGAAKKLLPLAGTAVGGFFGGPLGAGLGGNIAGTVAGALEMEADEMEWEAAKTFVRLAADAARNTALSPEGETPEDTAHQAVSNSAQKIAPVLIAPPVPQPMPMAPTWSGYGSRHHGGRWIRRGNQIVLFGV